MLPRVCPARPLAGAGVRSPLFPRARAVIIASFLALLAPTQSVRAQDTATLPPVRVESEAPRTIGGKPADAPCVIVDIAGHRAGHLDCASQRLQEAANIAQGQARAGIDAPVPKAGSPDVQLGVANQTATRLRMGNALGRSVHPERPASRPPRGGRP